jgi:hypothetical protein
MINDKTHPTYNGYFRENSYSFTAQYSSLSQTHFLYTISSLLSYQNGRGLGKHVDYPRFNFIGNLFESLKPDVFSTVRFSV